MRSKMDILNDARILYDFHSKHDEKSVNADIILAAGSHDLRVADYAAHLFLQGHSPLIICSGGFGKITGGIWDNPEGLVFGNRCIDLGVPENCVIIETCAQNSGDNFIFSKEILAKRGIHPKKGIIVCKPYMAKRAWATGTKQWPDVIWYVNPPKISFEEYPTSETPLDRMINLMVGDLQRLKVYADRGFQVPVEIPLNVWSAYEHLVFDGYDDFVIK